MEDDLHFSLNGRRPQFFENGRRPHFFLKMEDDLNFFLNGRRPQFLKMKTASFFFDNGKGPQYFVNKIIMQPETFKIETMVVEPLRVT